MSNTIPTEEEFVKDGFSEEEIAKLDAIETEASPDPSEGQEVPSVQEPAEPTPDPEYTAENPSQDQETAQGQRGPDDRAAAERRTRELRESKARNKRLEERLEQALGLIEAQNKPAPIEDVANQPPSKEELLAKLEKAVEQRDADAESQIRLQIDKINYQEQQSQLERQNEYQAQQQKMAQADQVVSRAEQQFQQEKQVDPTLPDAYKAYAEGYRYLAAVELGFVEYGQPYHPVDENEWKQVSDLGDKKIYADVATAGMNPMLSYPDIVRLNAQKFGWKPQAQQQTVPGRQAQPHAQQQPIQTQPPMAAQNADRHMSLSAAGGGAAPRQLNLEVISNMSQEEYNSLASTREGAKQLDIAHGLRRP